jgi:hypothetical protein
MDCFNSTTRRTSGGLSLIWRLNGIPSRVLDEFTPTDDLLTFDPVGEIALEFHHLTQGLSYGLQWASHMGVEARADVRC